MNPDGTLDTPRMPVAEHRRRLANSLFQITNGFGPMFDEAVDPRRDTRPDADSIFNPAFVDVPEPLKQSARDHRRTLPVQDVCAACSACSPSRRCRAASYHDGRSGQAATGIRSGSPARLRLAPHAAPRRSRRSNSRPVSMW